MNLINKSALIAAFSIISMSASALSINEITDLSKGDIEQKVLNSIKISVTDKEVVEASNEEGYHSISHSSDPQLIMQYLMLKELKEIRRDSLVQTHIQMRQYSHSAELININLKIYGALKKVLNNS